MSILFRVPQHAENGNILPFRCMYLRRETINLVVAKVFTELFTELFTQLHRSVRIKG